jgi:hypothetical protein
VTPTPTSTRPAGCADDAFEENDNCASAHPIVPGNYPNLQICSGDGDWYKMDFVVGDLITLDILFSHAQGDLDMVLYGSDCYAGLDWGTSYDDNERIQYNISTAGVYYVQVYGHQGAENRYDMALDVRSVHATATPTPTATVRWRRVYLPLLRKR